jgi:hypothetical protein
MGHLTLYSDWSFLVFLDLESVMLMAWRVDLVTGLAQKLLWALWVGIFELVYVVE